MAETKVFTKEEYVTLIPPVSTQEYERLKTSILEQGGLLMPIILNQDHVVLDGHHRLRACKELGIPISYSKKDFSNKPLDELKYVVTVNLHRRHLDEFQKAEIALKYDKLYKKIARDRWQATKFTAETGTEAAGKRWSGNGEEQEPYENHDANDDYGTKRDDEGEDDIGGGYGGGGAGGGGGGDGEEEMPLPSADGSRTRHGSATNQELAEQFGVSTSTLDRVKTILDEGTPEQVQSLRDKGEKGEGPGVRTVYEAVQSDKLKNKLAEDAKGAQELRRDNLRLLNKDFRAVTKQEIADNSVDLVLVLDFPEPRIREDEAGRQYQQVMESCSDWLKDGGILAMHVEQRFLPRAICEKPPLLQFYDLLSVFDTGFYELRPTRTIFSQEIRHMVVYVKGVRDTQPTAPQAGSTNRVGGGSEVFSTEQEFAEHMIKRLSPSDAVIVSPFMGQSRGIDGLAALKVRRTYIGIEPETTQYLSAMNLLYES
jgi:hypothetical protein